VRQWQQEEWPRRSRRSQPKALRNKRAASQPLTLHYSRCWGDDATVSGPNYGSTTTVDTGAADSARYERRKRRLASSSPTAIGHG
jgi:hypothetical protein